VAYSSEFGFLVSGHHSNDPEGNFGGNDYSQNSFWSESAFDNNSGAWTHVAKPDATAWTERATKPSSRGMFGATFADGVFVTVGNNGFAQLTTDATVWQEVNTGTDRRLRGVAYGNGKFVAVGNDGVIVQSPDAVSWSVSRAPVTALSAFAKPTIRAMAEGLGSFVAVGDLGTLLISTNAKSWDQKFYSTEYVPGSFTWAQAKADAVSKGGKIVWPTYPVTNAVPSGKLGRGDNVKLNINGLSEIKFELLRVDSWDGEEFRVYLNSDIVLRQSLVMNQNGVRYSGSSGEWAWTMEPIREEGGGQWGASMRWLVTLKSKIPSSGVVQLTSTLDEDINNESWSASNITVNRPLVLGAAGWIGGTDQGSEGTWRFDGTTNELTSIPWLTGQPNGGTAENYLFWNGKNFEDKPATMTSGYYIDYENQLDSMPLFGIAFGAGQFVAVGENRLYVSKNLKGWKRPTGTDKPFRAVKFLNGQFIAVGGAGSIFTSTNAVDWVSQTSGTSAELRAVAYGNGRYVVAGFGGTILTSTDAITWKASTTGNGNNLYGAAFGSGSFLVVGDGIAWTSTAGDLWRLRGNPSRAFKTVEYGNNQFIATSENSPKGSLLRSFDGTSWLEVPLGQSLAINYYGVYFSDSTIFAMGQYSTILQSLPYIGYTVVSVEKIEDASELGPKAGRFLLKRTGDLTKPLKIQVEVGGTATEVDDYTFQGPILP
jgi:hypothetical protein